MLIDDDQDDNFFHERAIRKYSPESKIIKTTTGLEAISYLRSAIDDVSMQPDLIFLDINMPQMNGWQFLEAYDDFATNLKCRATIIMLSTSQNPDDVQHSKTWNFVLDFITKPLTAVLMSDIHKKYFG